MDRAKYRVALEGCLNFRDLGGYACADGKTTREGVFYRSNCLSYLTDADIVMLCDMSITHVLDLRFPDEVAKDVNRMADREGVSYINISLADGAWLDPKVFPTSMAQFYTDLLEKSGARIAEAFRFFAAHADGRFAFHCTAGKDRTGVLAALLLDLAGVSREDIVADYALTQTYMWDVFMQAKLEMEAKYGMPLADYIFEAAPESMTLFLDVLYTRYGNAAAYLKVIDLPDDEIAIVREMLS